MSWSGVELDGGPAPPAPENIAAVMQLYPIGERYFQEFTLRQVLLNAAKKRIRALCRWHFQPGGGPEYCRTCRDDDLPCAQGESGADGLLCPYREHALTSAQEHEAWDVLLACQGPLRLAASGHVIGIDMDAALRMAEARGCDLAVLSDLLPATEAGLVDAFGSVGPQRSPTWAGAP